MAQIVLPNQLTNGTVADATQVMANFNAIVDVVNGNLGSDNLGSITGSDVIITDLNGGSNILNNFTQRFQAGSILIPNIPSTEFGYGDVTFPVTFPGTPIVLTAVNAGTPDHMYVSTNKITSKGFQVVVRNTYTDTRSIDVPWLAIYTGAWA